jgi:hypothetical protein
VKGVQTKNVPVDEIQDFEAADEESALLKQTVV